MVFISEDELEYSKYDDKNTENTRNGKRSKKVRSNHRELQKDVPRDRNREFEPQIVKKHLKDVSSIDDQVSSSKIWVMLPFCHLHGGNFHPQLHLCHFLLLSL